MLILGLGQADIDPEKHGRNAMNISRRAVLAASASVPFLSGAARAANNVSISLDPSRSLGYEISSVAVPGLLSADNHAYVRLVRNLGRQGVIRIGGNTSDFSSYDAKGKAASLPKGSIVTEQNLRQLRTFLDATGWKLIWGLNLGDDKLDNAIEEARAFTHAAGDRLLALEIGNEPDLFVRAGHRQGNYGYADWHAEYVRYKAAIRAQLPHVPLAGPDIAGTAVEWFEGFAHDEGSDIALLTAHHYIAGQANPGSTLEMMLQDDKKYESVLAKFQAVAQAAHLPYRICETASYSGGGKEGASDTFAAALWVLDYLFVLASYGCGGVNMETGVNHLGWISHYTPIGDDLASHYSAAPEYYGLLAFAQIAQGDLIATTCDAGGINLTAHGTQKSAREMTLTVINRDLSKDASVEVAATDTLKQAHVMRLAAKSISATSGVTLGGASVTNEGLWAGERSDSVKVAGGKALLDVPAGSAALVTLII
jgi:hypothetical protein